MNIIKLQKGLLSWFWFEPEDYKSFSSIDNICINLYKQHLPEEYYPEKPSKNAKYEMLSPLIRYGLIEFYGNNKYRLSPSCALHSNSHIIFCNIPVLLQQKVNDLCIYNNELGIQVYKKSNAVVTFLKERVVPHSKFVLFDFLKAVSSFEKIINAWNDETVIDSNGYSFFCSNNTWSNNVLKPSKGLFKKSDEVYAQRVCKISGNKWKCIPSRESNIDGFNIAVIWGQIQNNWDIKIKYYVNESKLVVKNIFFPLVIERLLFLNTLLEGEYEFDFLKGQYFIRQKDFNILNKIFDNKIEVI